MIIGLNLTLHRHSGRFGSQIQVLIDNYEPMTLVLERELA
jgi:D-Tyr-tRNAtyr deacylase